MPGTVPQPTSIIHMTHVSNFPAILAAGRLLPTASLQGVGTAIVSVAYSSIQAQRAAKAVPCGPGGCLHDYVPFYFTIRSPMLYTINRGNVACAGGQDSLVHLVSSAQAVSAAGKNYVFSDGHGIMSFSNFYDDLAHLGNVDWPVIAGTYWNDTAADGDWKRRKQAEFLVHNDFPLHLLSKIVVRVASVQAQVIAALAGAGLAVPVIVDAS